MKAGDAGEELTVWLRSVGLDAQGFIVMGLTLAFEFPEYARALYVSAGEDSEPDDQAVILDHLREWIEEHPIEIAA